MRALIIGNQDRYDKFYPQSAFADSVEKYYVPLKTPFGQIPEEALSAEFLAADAIAEVPAELIARMPELKIIHSEGVGYNGIDCAAAAGRGIYVCNNRGINAAAVAEQSLLLMLGLLRGVVSGDRAVREGRQIQTKERMMVKGITELSECRVGLLGFGDIAKALALLLRPFGCEVFYHATGRKSPEVEEKYGAVYQELPDMLKTCNIISIHVPVTPATRSMVDLEFLKAMRRDALLINTARGEIVDNEALCQALREGWIAGAGLDTVAPEPVREDNPLLHLPKEIGEKILFAPHIGGITTQTFRKAHRNIWAAFESVSRGERPENVVNGV